MIRAIAILVLLGSTSTVWAQCTRASLQSAVDKYLDALKKGTPSIMPLAEQAKYTENKKEVPFGQGVWQTPFTPDFQRSVLDVQACETFTEIIYAGEPNARVIGTHLKLAGDKIAEVHSLVSKPGDWLFNAKNYLKYSSAEKWDILPPAARTDRQRLINAGNAYFDVFNDYSNFDKIPWGTPCVRIEGGAYTNEKNDPNPSCTVGVPKQGGVKLVNRHFIVDEDMGTVVGLADFGSIEGLNDSHMFRLENGKLRYVHTITVYHNGPPPAGQKKAPAKIPQ